MGQELLGSVAYASVFQHAGKLVDRATDRDFGFHGSQVDQADHAAHAFRAAHTRSLHPDHWQTSAGRREAALEHYSSIDLHVTAVVALGGDAIWARRRERVATSGGSVSSLECDSWPRALQLGLALGERF